VPSNTLYSSCLFRSHRSSGAGVTVGLLLLAVLSLLLSGCDRDGGTTTPEPTPDLGEVGVVVNSVEQTVTLFRVDDPDESPRTVDLQTGGDATPVGAAVRGDRALIPLGLYPAAVLVDLKAGQVIRTIGLPQGSGATGAIFLTDSTALVANPDRNSVSHLDLEAGSAGMEIEVGRYPQGFVETDAGIVVINAELENFQPAGPGTLTVLDPEAMAVTGEVTLTGQNSNSGVVTSDGRLFILHGGSWGADDGSLSEVDISLSPPPSVRSHLSGRVPLGILLELWNHPVGYGIGNLCPGSGRSHPSGGDSLQCRAGCGRRGSPVCLDPRMSGSRTGSASWRGSVRPGRGECGDLPGMGGIRLGGHRVEKPVEEVQGPPPRSVVPVLPRRACRVTGGGQVLSP